MDYARGPQGPSRSHLSAGGHLGTGQNAKGAPCAKPSLTLGQATTQAGLPGTCLP